MDTLLKKAHGPGMFSLLGFALMLTVFIAAGCSMFDRPVKAEVEQTLQDGTTVQEGGQIYVNEKGQTTALEANPDTGEKYEKYTAPDPTVPEGYQKQGEKVADMLPPPFNWLAALGLAGVGAGVVAVTRKRREAQLAKDGIKTKKKA
jgi:hypothetical protein